MKRILLFLILIISNLALSQNKNLAVENFLIESSQVIWQKTFETELSKEDIIDKIKTSGNFENINISDYKLTAEIKELSIDYKGYGESEMSTPMYLSRSFVKAFYIFEFKDKKYRVTVKNIKFVQKYDDGLSKANEVSEIETYV
jgi:hypothetical protein